MRRRLAGPTTIAIAALTVVLGTAACGSADEPGAERSDAVTVLDTSVPDDVAVSTTDAPTTTATSAGPTTTALAGVESTEPTAAPTTAATTTTVGAELGISEDDVTELEQQLDEIDAVLIDLEAQLSED